MVEKREGVRGGIVLFVLVAVGFGVDKTKKVVDVDVWLRDGLG